MGKKMKYLILFLRWAEPISKSSVADATYFVIRSSLASYSPVICSATNCESPNLEYVHTLFGLDFDEDFWDYVVLGLLSWTYGDLHSFALPLRLALRCFSLLASLDPSAQLPMPHHILFLAGPNGDFCFSFVSRRGSWNVCACVVVAPTIITVKNLFVRLYSWNSSSKALMATNSKDFFL